MLSRAARSLTSREGHSLGLVVMHSRYHLQRTRQHKVQSLLALTKQDRGYFEAKVWCVIVEFNVPFDTV